MSKGISYFITIVLFLLFLPFISNAGVNHWTQLGPEGGTINNITINPVDQTIIYAGTGGKLFKSTDSGEQWAALTHDSFSFINTFVIDHKTPTTIYAGSGHNGVFKSTDAGENWTLIKDEIAGVRSMAIDPENAHILYIGARDGGSSKPGGVFRSTNKGETWTAINNGIDKNVMIIRIAPDTPTTLYAASQGGIYKSVDSGENWSLINNKSVEALIIDPNNSLIVYAGLYKDIIKSTNGGETWESLNDGMFDNIKILELSIPPSSPEIIFAGTDSGIFKSTESGESWQKLENDLTITSVSVIAFNKTEPDIMYAGTLVKGIYKSNNQGQNWSNSNNGLIANSFSNFTIDPFNSNIFYTVIKNGCGVYKSTDRGQTWSEKTYGLEGLRIQSFALNSKTPTTLYTGTASKGVFKSIDGGNNWTAISNGLYLSIQSLIVDPISPDTLYASTSGGLYKSLDGAENWAALRDAPGGLHHLTIDLQRPNILYSASGFSYNSTCEVFKSVDGGQSWSKGKMIGNSNLSYIIDIAIDPFTPDTLYAALQGGIYKSSDGAEEWKFLAQPNNNNVYGGFYSAIAVNYENPNILYAARGSDGFFISKDSGYTWIDNSSKLGGIYISRITIDPKSPETIFLNTSRHGINHRTVSPPVVITDEATDNTNNSVILNGSINPMNLDTNYYFLTNKNFSKYSIKPRMILLASMGSKSVSQEINGLESNIEYKFRIVAENSLGVYYGEWKTFSINSVNSGVNEGDSSASKGDSGGCFIDVSTGI